MKNIFSSLKDDFKTVPAGILYSPFHFVFKAPKGNFGVPGPFPGKT
jgi:hypothetical protein